jgi:hypothetical protein
VDEAKIVVKRQLGYVYEKNGTTFLKHTSEMDTKELTGFIDRFRNWSAHNGHYLPSADEFDKHYAEIMREVEYAEYNMTKHG